MIQMNKIHMSWNTVFYAIVQNPCRFDTIWKSVLQVLVDTCKSLREMIPFKKPYFVRKL